MHPRVAFVVALGLGALACSKNRTTSPAPSAKATSSAVSAPSASARVATLPALDEPAVKTLVDAWLAAQNDGDFSAYERLYAARFTGVKRAGPRETTYDRDGWLADRKNMFARPMRVEAAKLELSVTPAGASAELEQTWSSATFRDVGVKRLVIVPTAAGARIAREEMLSSLVVGADARTAPKDLVVVHRDGLILNTDAQDTWASSPSRIATPNHVVVRDVDETKLPPELRAWKGRSVRTFAADGSTCTTQVSGFVLRAEVVPHFGMVQHWRGELGQPPSGPGTIAEEVWELAGTGGRVLVGKLAQACGGGLWALAEDKAPPRIASRVSGTPELRDRALEAFRSLPSYQQIQKEFVAGTKTPNQPWEGNDARVSIFESGGKPVVISVGAQAGAGCGEFYGVLNAVFVPRPGANAELQLLDEPTSPDPLEPLAAFDIDGNGSFEVLFTPGALAYERLLWRREAKGTLTELFTVPYLDCPC